MLARPVDTDSRSLSVSYLRSALLLAAHAGHELAARQADLVHPQPEREVVVEGAILEESKEFGDLVDSWRFSVEMAVADEIEGRVSYWLDMAIEAAVVLGIRTHGDGLPTDDNDDVRLAGVADDLLDQLVDRLADEGCDIPGIRPYLDMREAAARARRPQKIWRSRSAPWEARTDWIRGSGIERPYQWVVLRDGERTHVGTREIGRGEVKHRLSVRNADVELLQSLLSSVHQPLST